MHNEVKETRENSHAENLPAIPIPTGTRWREFRIKYIPLLVFALTGLLIWFFWTELPPSTGVRGIGEGAVSMLASPADGFMEDVAVEPHGRVSAGDPIAKIVPFDPQAQMALFQAQLQISRLAMEPSIVDRNALNYEQLRVDALRLKTSLAMAQKNLDLAETQLPRHEALLKERLISRDVYDTTVRNREFYRAEVEQSTQALKEIDQRMEQLRSISDPIGASTNSPLDSLLPRLEEQMASVQTNFHAITLTAPIGGEVTLIRQGREFVRLGEPIMMINADRADRIVAYLKQPLPFDPQVGMQVQIVTRNRKPQRFLTEISQVGARVEVITNSIAFLQPGALVDSGLPVILPVPPDVHIRPGEVVDVEWKNSGAPSRLAQRLFGNK